MIEVHVRGDGISTVNEKGRDLALPEPTFECLYEKLNVDRNERKLILPIVNGKAIPRGNCVLGDGDEIILHMPVSGG